MKPTITAGIANPEGMAVDAKGKIFVTNSLPNSAFANVTSYTPEGTQISPTISDGIYDPFPRAVN